MNYVVFRTCFCYTLAMSVSYKKLWKLLIDLGLTKSKFRELAKISPSTLYKLNKSEYVSLEIIERICLSLDCTPNDVFEVINDEKDL